MNRLANSSSRFQAFLNKISALLLIAGVLVLSFSTASASDQINVIEITDYQTEQQLLFDSRTQFNLPEKIIEAIKNEVTVTFHTEIIFEEHQKFAGIRYRRQRMKMHYHTQLHYASFTNRYTLINERNNKVQSFKSLDEALRTLGTLSAFSILPLSELHPNQKYTLKLNIKLDRWRLPAPLVLNSLLDPDWNLDSGWFERRVFTPKSWS